ncbi:MAG TPA: hypothetical protein PKE64_28375 [Anaerolineae bacterium]|nr:hypothetical protein [Anaerolineae bacterium]HMR67946.1 hypothetical protein [Anaerolineae bacterium]
MTIFWRFAWLFTILLASCSVAAAPAEKEAGEPRAAPSPWPEPTTAAAACPVTPTVVDQPPDDPNADPFSPGPWFINTDRTVWVSAPPAGYIWRVGGEKVAWIRPQGSDLVVTGRRLDAEAPPLRASIPCCYPTGFQVTGLYFPTEGCWEVEGRAGQHSLKFVIEVGPATLE